MNRTGLVLSVAVFGTIGTGFTMAGERKPLKEFLGQKYIHGLPIQEAKSYPGESLPELVVLLDDPAFEPYRPNVVLMMGLLGNPAATPKLIEFLEKTEGEVSHGTFVAMLVVNTALGNLANEGDEAALKYLLDGAELDTWKKRGLRWTYPDLGAEERSTLLATKAIGGLAYAGNPAAEARLIEVRARGPERLKKAAEGALELHGHIAEFGIDEVFMICFNQSETNRLVG